MQKQDEVSSLEAYRKHLDKVASLGNHKDLLVFRGWYMRLFNPSPGSRILDLGGYVGATALHYAEKGHEVVSVEGAKLLCDRFEQNTKHCPAITLVRSLIEDFHTDEPFDACCCTEILNHVVDPAALLKVAYDSLRDGGELFVTVTSEKWGLHHIEQSQLGRLVADAGFAAHTKRWTDGEHAGQFVCRGLK